MWAAPLASRMVLLGVLWIIVAAIVMLRRGYRPARLFLLAWSLFLAGTAAFTLLAFGIIPRNFWTHNGVQIGSALEMLLLSLALGSRYAGLRNENIRIVQETNEKLERSVVDRTRQKIHRKNDILVFLALYNLTFFEHFHHSLPFRSFNQQKFIYSSFEVLFAFLRWNRVFYQHERLLEKDTGTPVRKRHPLFFFSSLAFSYYFLEKVVSFSNWCPGVPVSRCLFL